MSMELLFPDLEVCWQIYRSIPSAYIHSRMYFGATGWRIAVNAIHENNVFDKLIAALPRKTQK